MNKVLFYYYYYYYYYYSGCLGIYPLSNQPEREKCYLWVASLFISNSEGDFPKAVGVAHLHQQKPVQFFCFAKSCPAYFRIIYPWILSHSVPLTAIGRRMLRSSESVEMSFSLRNCRNSSLVKWLPLSLKAVIVLWQRHYFQKLLISIYHS